MSIEKKIFLMIQVNQSDDVVLTATAAAAAAAAAC